LARAGNPRKIPFSLFTRRRRRRVKRETLKEDHEGAHYMLKTGVGQYSKRDVLLHKTGPQVAQELHACIGCNECLLACPALAEPITIDVLNRETLGGMISAPVARFARSCFQCGACVAPCPVGLHRDAMMMWLKVRLLRSGQEE
jgi:ferredoxin